MKYTPLNNMAIYPKPASVFAHSPKAQENTPDSHPQP